MAKWLIKSEPGSYGWDDLVRDGRTMWDGVRNHQARGHIAAMREGDEALFYHSGGDKAAVGVARIAGAPEADPSTSLGTGPSTSLGTGPSTSLGTNGAEGKWLKVPVAPVRALARPVTLAEVKADPRLKDMALVRQPRLSVSPVAEAEWAAILALAGDGGAGI